MRRGWKWKGGFEKAFQSHLKPYVNQSSLTFEVNLEKHIEDNFPALRFQLCIFSQFRPCHSLCNNYFSFWSCWSDSPIFFYAFRMHFCVHWKPHILFWFVLQSSNIKSKSEDTRQAHYFFSEPVVARFMRFTAEQVKDSKCLSDLVVSGCTVGKAHMDLRFRRYGGHV